eukprot:Cvel_21317.t1-p1 / transcript=Cvel_21317.t1 / gene=Cvel_21317 / organism=Chromera_velia_CCMP2878 / gene_product=hypothetical protein / transcript_product=hypothetical protein / location=Cvel_scaffold1987:31821-35875(+) / protein_length=839 / sequence_SO=supercontig / SO=protein_coding / is_pseudo=false
MHWSASSSGQSNLGPHLPKKSGSREGNQFPPQASGAAAVPASAVAAGLTHGDGGTKGGGQRVSKRRRTADLFGHFRTSLMKQTHLAIDKADVHPKRERKKLAQMLSYISALPHVSEWLPLDFSKKILEKWVRDTRNTVHLFTLKQLNFSEATTTLVGFVTLDISPEAQHTCWSLVQGRGALANAATSFHSKSSTWGLIECLVAAVEGQALGTFMTAGVIAKAIDIGIGNLLVRAPLLSVSPSPHDDLAPHPLPLPPGGPSISASMGVDGDGEGEGNRQRGSAYACQRGEREREGVKRKERGDPSSHPGGEEKGPRGPGGGRPTRKAELGPEGPPTTSPGGAGVEGGKRDGDAKGEGGEIVQSTAAPTSASSSAAASSAAASFAASGSAATNTKSSLHMIQKLQQRQTSEDQMSFPPIATSLPASSSLQRPEGRGEEGATGGTVTDLKRRRLEREKESKETAGSVSKRDKKSEERGEEAGGSKKNTGGEGEEPNSPRGLPGRDKDREKEKDGGGKPRIQVHTRLLGLLNTFLFSYVETSIGGRDKLGFSSLAGRPPEPPPPPSSPTKGPPPSLPTGSNGSSVALQTAAAAGVGGQNSTPGCPPVAIAGGGGGGSPTSKEMPGGRGDVQSACRQPQLNQTQQQQQQQQTGAPNGNGVNPMTALAPLASSSSSCELPAQTPPTESAAAPPVPVSAPTSRVTTAPGTFLGGPGPGQTGAPSGGPGMLLNDGGAASGRSHVQHPPQASRDEHWQGGASSSVAGPSAGPGPSSSAAPAAAAASGGPPATTPAGATASAAATVGTLTEEEGDADEEGRHGAGTASDSAAENSGEGDWGGEGGDTLG